MQNVGEFDLPGVVPWMDACSAVQTGGLGQLAWNFTNKHRVPSDRDMAQNGIYGWLVLVKKHDGDWA